MKRGWLDTSVDYKSCTKQLISAESSSQAGTAVSDSSL
jgi:hypothetical protein